MNELTGLLKDVASRLRYSTSRIGQPRIKEDIFFLHVPKCGGTSIGQSLRRLYQSANPQEDRFTVRMDVPATQLTSILLGQNTYDYSRQLLPYFLGGRYRYVEGEFAFSEVAYENFSEQYEFITLLRDPVKRWFSAYFYNRHKTGAHFRVDLELEEFLETEMAGIYGCDYSMIFADHALSDDFTSGTAVESAIENLKRFDLVGVLEQLPMFIREFNSLYGVELKIPRLNTSPVSSEERERIITRDIQARVEELCQPNITIYECARDKMAGTYADKKNR